MVHWFVLYFWFTFHPHFLVHALHTCYASFPHCRALAYMLRMESSSMLKQYAHTHKQQGYTNDCQCQYKGYEQCFHHYRLQKYRKNNK